MFEVPPWVIYCSYAAISLGTLSGGWKIVHTMGSRLTKLNTRGGFCAETAAAMSILLATQLGLPISTTHTTAGAIAGVGSIHRLKAVRWGVATNILTEQECAGSPDPRSPDVDVRRYCNTAYGQYPGRARITAFGCDGTFTCTLR